MSDKYDEFAERGTSHDETLPEQPQGGVAAPAAAPPAEPRDDGADEHRSEGDSSGATRRFELPPAEDDPPAEAPSQAEQLFDEAPAAGLPSAPAAVFDHEQAAEA